MRVKYEEINRGRHDQLKRTSSDFFPYSAILHFNTAPAGKVLSIEIKILY